MVTRHKHDAIIVISLLSFGISLYLAFSHYLGFVVPCDVTHGCETVLTSKYSVFLGLPLAVWGAGYCVAVIISSLLANHYLVWEKLLLILLGIGAVLSLVFLGLQFFVIKKVCQYCLTVDLLNLFLFIWDINIEHRKPVPLQPVDA